VPYDEPDALAMLERPVCFFDLSDEENVKVLLGLVHILAGIIGLC
jgi:hypothetical protein